MSSKNELYQKSVVFCLVKIVSIRLISWSSLYKKALNCTVFVP